MPIFEYNGRRFDVKDEDVESFISEAPDAVSNQEFGGKKYKVKASDYKQWMADIGSASQVVDDYGMPIRPAVSTIEDAPKAENTKAEAAKEPAPVETARANSEQMIEGEQVQETQPAISSLFAPNAPESMLDLGYKAEDKFATALQKKTSKDIDDKRRARYQELMNPYTTTYAKEEQRARLNDQLQAQTNMPAVARTNMMRLSNRLNEEARPWIEADKKVWTPEEAAEFRQQVIDETWQDPYAIVPESYKAKLAKEAGKELSEDEYFVAWMGEKGKGRKQYLQNELAEYLVNPDTENAKKMAEIKERTEGKARDERFQRAESMKYWNPSMGGAAIAAAEMTGDARSIASQTAKAISNAEDIVRAYKNHQDDENFFVGAFKGMKDGLSNVDNWTGVYMLGEMGIMNKIADKVEKGEELTQEENDYLDAQAYKLAVEAALADDLGWGYKSGNVTGASVPFMLQMLASPVSASSGATVNKAFAAVGKRAINRYGGTILKKVLGSGVVQKIGTGLSRTVGQSRGMRLVGKAALRTVEAAESGLMQSVLFNSDKIAADAMRRHQGNAMVTNRANEQYGTSLVADEAEDWWKAIGKSVVAMTAENGSEYLGATLLEPASKMLGKSIGELTDGLALRKIFDAASETGAGRALYRLAKMPGNQVAGAIAGKVQWNGLFNEYLEEVVNGGVQVLIGDMEAEKWTSLKHNAETLLGLAWTSGAFGVANGVSRARSYAKARKLMNQQDLIGTQAFSAEPEKWEEFKRSLEGLDYAGLEERMRQLQVAVQTATPEQRSLNRAKVSAAFNYMMGYAQMMGIEAADNTGAQQTPEQAEADEALGEGISATEEQQGDIVRDMKYSANVAAASVGAENIDEWLAQYGESADIQLAGVRNDANLTDETKAHVTDYINNKQRYEGVMAVAEQEIEARVNTAVQEFDAQVNQETGRVTEVRVKAGDEVAVMEHGENKGRVAYVIAGNPESGSVYVRYEDGTIEPVASTDILNTVSDEDAAPLREAIKESVSLQAVAEVAERMQLQEAAAEERAQFSITQEAQESATPIETTENEAPAVAETAEEAATEEKSDADMLIEDESVPLEDRQAIIYNNVEDSKAALEQAQAEHNKLQESQPKGKDFRSLSEYKAAQAQWQEQMQTAQAVLAEAQAQADLWNGVSARLTEREAQKATAQAQVASTESLLTEAAQASPIDMETARAEAQEHNATIDVKEVARQTGQKASSIKNLLDLANKMGVKVNFEAYTSTEGGGNGQLTNGESMAKNRTITISKLSMAQGAAIEFIVGHELTHQVKADGIKENWEALRDAVKNALGEEAYDALIKTTKALYAEAYSGRSQERFEQDIEEEVVADMFGEVLLDARNVRNLLGIKPGLARRIYEYLKDMLANTQMPQSIVDVVEAWQQLAEGKGENVQGEEKKHSIVGVTGATALDKAEGVTVRMDNLDVAHEMRKAGKDAETIWLATGWEMGADGRWRYEVLEDFAYEEPHAKAERLAEEKKDAENEKEKIYRLLDRFPARGLTDAQKAKKKELNQRLKELIKKTDRLREELTDMLRDKTVGELIGTDNNIIKAYPELADLPVSFVERDEYINAGYKGSFDGTGIWISPYLEDTASTLLHELQHAIQRIEGFARGGNTGTVQTKAEALKQDVRPLHELMLETPEWAEKQRLATQYFDLLESNPEEAEKVWNRISEIDQSGVLKPIQSMRTQLKNKYGSNATVGKLLSGPYAEDAEVWNELPNSFNSKYEAYRSLAGETEARNVQSRLNMSEEERKAKPLSATEDVERGEQVVKYSITNKEGEQLEETANATRYSIVVDPQLIAELEASPKRKGYRNVVQREDGLFEAPMGNSLRGNGITVENTPFAMGQWEQSEEHPELVYGDNKITLVKPDGKTVADVNYNPYIHNRLNTLNAQFKQAWERPDLVYVETEVPETDLESGYMAEHAHLSTGVHQWSNGALMLSRYDKPVRIVPWEEVAGPWIEKYKKSGVHFDIVPPALRPILTEAGVEILPPHKGMGENCVKAYEEWKAGQEDVNVNAYRLSDEIDENGRPFVLNSKGNIIFGEIEKSSGLTPAPILLSEGIITNPATNEGYGLVHIEARHGDQIRNAGYKSIVEFVEEVAQNYEVIREGKDRQGHQTYMLQLTDKHNNTLMVELSGDKSYWNINTAGIFKKSYGRNNKEVYHRHTTEKQSTETAGVSQGIEQSGTQMPSSMNTPTSSASKDTQSVSTEQTDKEEISEKSAESNVEVTNEEVMHSISPIEGYTYSEVIDMVQNDVENILSEEGVYNVEAVEFWAHGSRMRGNAREDSDLDVVMFYKGNEKEDYLFNLVNEQELAIDGIKVDVNPIRISNEQDIARYKEKSARYDQEMRFSLAGLHNISEEKLKKAIKQGGLANPSVAVIDLDTRDHNTYGDITLVLPSYMIDKKQGRNAGTYMGDAWTPTYPRVSMRLDNKGWRKIDEFIASISDDAHMRSNMHYAVEDFMQGGTTPYMQYAFLKTKGIGIPFVYKNNDRYISNEELKELIGMDAITAFNGSIDAYNKFKELPKEVQDELYIWIINRGDKAKIKAMKESIQKDQRYAKLLDYEVPFSKFNMFANDTFRREQDNGKIDYAKTFSEANNHVATNGLGAEYNAWISNLLEEAGAEEYIFVGFTPSGNAKYLPHTLENVSKVMKKDGKSNVYNDTGFGPTRAGIIKALSTLGQIRKNSDALRTDINTVNETKEELADRLYELRSKLADMRKLSDNPFINGDYAERRLQEALSRKNPVRHLNEEYGYNIEEDGDFAKKLESFIDDVRKAPVRYFETKFERPVMLDEFHAAVIPNDTDTEVVKALEKVGLNVETYERGNDAERKEALLRASDEHVRFSLSAEEQGIVDAAKANGTYMKAPNDKPTNLTKKQWAMVRTQNFKKWFGDWENEPKNASKIVDENGEPRVMYHGSSWRPLQEEDGNAVFKMQDGALGEGAYFTSSFPEAADYVRDKLDNWDMSEDEIDEGGYVTEVFLNIRDDKQILRDNAYGNDSFIAAATSPNQIKSATDNVGTFDAKNADIRYSMPADILAANERFNEELEALTQENADRMIFDLGTPSAYLKSAGVHSKPMKLYGSKIIKKQKKHGFKLEELRNLPIAIADPIAVFDNHDEEGNRGILTELNTDAGNILVAISLGKGADIDFNIISSAFGKGTNKIVNWINKGFGKYYNKEKALEYLHLAAPIAAASDNQELSDATKIVQDFQNPPLPADQSSQSQENVTPTVQNGDEKFSLSPIAPRGESESIMDYAHRVAEELQKQRESDALQKETLSTIADIRRQAKANEEYRRILNDKEPHTIEEAASVALAGTKLLWDDYTDGSKVLKGVKSMMGWKEGERKKMFTMFASRENGGVSLERVAEAVMQVCDEYNIPYDETDAMVGMSAVMEVLGSAEKPSDISGYIESNRLQTIKSMIEEDQHMHNEHLNAEHINRYGMSYDDYAEIMDQIDREQDESNAEDKKVIGWLYGQHENQQKRIDRLKEEAERLKSEGVNSGAYQALMGELNKAKEEARATQEALESTLAQLRNAKGQVTRYKKARAKWEEINQRWKAMYQRIQEMVHGKNIGMIDKNTLNSILRTTRAIGAGSVSKLAEQIEDIEHILLGIESKAVRSEIDKLLAVKTTAVNQRGIDTGKSVDPKTQKILQRLRDSMQLMTHHQAMDEIHALLSQNWHIRNDETGEYAGWTEEQKAERIRENKNRISALKTEAAEALNATAISTEENIQQQIASVIEQEEKGEFVGDVDVTLTALRIQGQMAAINTAEREASVMESQLEQRWSELRGVRRALKEGNIPEDKKEEYKQKAQMLTSIIEALNSCINATRESNLQDMQTLRDTLLNLITEGRGNLKEKIEAERKRRNEFIRNAVHDVSGSSSVPQTVNTGKKDENGKLPWYKAWYANAISSFDYMLQKVATRTMGRDSWLYKQFMEGPEGVMAANDTYTQGLQQAKDILDDKAREFFGKDYKSAMQENSKVKTVEGVEIVANPELVAEGKPSVYIPLKLSKGQATYVCMLWKMRDGRAKLEAQGFSDEIIERLKEYAGEENLAWAEWIQEEYLPEMREKYNERYREMYNTDMAAIEHYVPIKINGSSLRQEVQLDAPVDVSGLQTKNGSLIKRVANVKPIDLSVNAMELILDHVTQMEEFYAYAPVRRDLQYVLSSQAFRNMVNANSPGAFNRLKEAAKVAVRGNMPPADLNTQWESIMSNAQRGLVSANIAYRSATAIKQALSVPAFYAYSQNPGYLLALTKNIGLDYGRNIIPFLTMPFPVIGQAGTRGLMKATQIDGSKTKKIMGANFRWCMENIPDFRDRVLKNSAGDIRLEEGTLGNILDKYTEIGMAHNVFVDALTVSIGLKSIYDYEMRQSRKRIAKDKKEMQMDDSWTAEELEAWEKEELRKADNLAKTKAVLYCNQTQQSGNPALLAPMQVSRSFVLRSLSNYKNSKLGYVRMFLEGTRDMARALRFKGTRKAMVDEYASRIVQETGKPIEEAKKIAGSYINSQMRKAMFSAAWYGIVLNLLWELGSKGLMGLMWDEDDDKNKAEEILGENAVEIVEMLSYTPISGIPAVDWAHELITEGRAPGIGLSFEEIGNLARDIKRETDKNGIGWQMALIGAKYGMKFAGVDAEIFANAMDGYYRCIEDTRINDEKILALMLILNSPKSNRMAVARELYKDKSPEEFERAIMIAGRYGQPVWTFGREMTKQVEADMKQWYYDANATEEQKERDAQEKLFKEQIDNIESMDDAMRLYDSTTDPKMRKRIKNKARDLEEEEPTFGDKVRKMLAEEEEGDTETYDNISNGKDMAEDLAIKALKEELEPVYNEYKESGYSSEYRRSHKEEIDRYRRLSQVESSIGHFKKRIKQDAGNPEKQQKHLEQIRKLRKSVLD